MAKCEKGTEPQSAAVSMACFSVGIRWERTRIHYTETVPETTGKFKGMNDVRHTTELNFAMMISREAQKEEARHPVHVETRCSKHMAYY